MKGFIEVKAADGSKAVIAVSSISVVEDHDSTETRIILKEKIGTAEQNYSILTNESLFDLKLKMSSAILDD